VGAIGQPSVRITVEEQSQIAQARRSAVEIAGRIGFNETWVGQVAIIATEVCTNLLKHARGGEILLRVTEDNGAPLAGLELLALDKGPGMRDLGKCLADGYTTGSSPGLGMGAVQRLATESDFYSVADQGTAVLARWAPGAPSGPASDRDPLRFGAVNLQKAGQEVCGDAWGMEEGPDFTTIVLADGLGHGYDAHLASQEAVRMLRDHPGVSVEVLVQYVHQALRSFRGAAVAAVRLDRSRQQVSFCGMGNIMGQIYAGSQPSQHMVSVNGTAGHTSQRLRGFVYSWPKDGMIVLWSDGLSTGTTLLSQPALALHDPSLIAGVLYRDFARGSDDATVVVAKAG
jgi:anti-sigma regulatory factor (Ser/Thr protein kinase)